ncbi:MAG TPA: fumarylacetoacetase [Cyclobacteriaceae bacterium]|jgi:fumarylacetoacetase
MRNPNDAKLKSWVEVPKGSDFPIQNLPFGIFSTGTRNKRAGIAIGNQIVDLSELAKRGYLDIPGIDTAVFSNDILNAFLEVGRKKCGEVRMKVSELLDSENSILRNNENEIREVFVNMADAQMHMPINVRNYTDFYSSKEHAINIGTMFRDPENALLPNWKHLPVAYHGRASSIIISGQDIYRPKGQTKSADDPRPIYGATQRLDFELEIAFVACKSNALGDQITLANAEDYIFGFCLFNDWSARDIQAWEYVPLGPFLSKNFASAISPWIVTLDALEPFRVDGPTQEEKVLPYLAFEGSKNFDINLEVFIKPDKSEEVSVSKSNFRHMYWNVNQQLAHHTVNGCNIQIGDMYASGTISGPTPDTYGSMLELAWQGTKPIRMKDGSVRKFINDGDEVILRGYCEKNGIRVGFGEVRNRVLPAK